MIREGKSLKIITNTSLRHNYVLTFPFPSDANVLWSVFLTITILLGASWPWTVFENLFMSVRLPGKKFFVFVLSTKEGMLLELLEYDRIKWIVFLIQIYSDWKLIVGLMNLIRFKLSRRAKLKWRNFSSETLSPSKWDLMICSFPIFVPCWWPSVTDWNNNGLFLRDVEKCGSYSVTSGIAGKRIW